MLCSTPIIHIKAKRRKNQAHAWILQEKPAQYSYYPTKSTQFPFKNGIGCKLDPLKMQHFFNNLMKLVYIHGNYTGQSVIVNNKYGVSRK